jgi:hypothetical protein
MPASADRPVHLNSKHWGLTALRGRA